MTTAEKWAKHTELTTKADRLHAEWLATCREINALLMMKTADQPKSRAKR